tara:strand:+ start:1431 stop:1940 length:510 start_codon:yes stop_codon:yes gene_type:complete
MIEKVKIETVFLNQSNPRTIRKDKFQKLVNSIKEFPEMLQLRPIVVNSEMEILGGNMRYKACLELNHKEVHIIKADSLTKDQIQQFLIKDNVGFGEWDWDILANEWDTKELKDWGVDVPVFNLPDDAKDLSDAVKECLRLEVETENEEEQEKLYNEFIERGYICRILTL